MESWSLRIKQQVIAYLWRTIEKSMAEGIKNAERIIRGGL